MLRRQSRLRRNPQHGKFPGKVDGGKHPRQPARCFALRFTTNWQCRNCDEALHRGIQTHTYAGELGKFRKIFRGHVEGGFHGSVARENYRAVSCWSKSNRSK